MRDRGFKKVIFPTAMALFSHQSGIAHVGNFVRLNVFIHKAIIIYLNFRCHFSVFLLQALMLSNRKKACIFSLVWVISTRRANLCKRVCFVSFTGEALLYSGQLSMFCSHIVTFTLAVSYSNASLSTDCCSQNKILHLRCLCIAVNIYSTDG